METATLRPDEPNDGVDSTPVERMTGQKPVSNGIEKARMAFVTKMVGAFATINGDAEELEDAEVSCREDGVRPEGEEVTAAHRENGVHGSSEDEPRSLQEIELERRRIIDNQVVRRKIIKHWAFSDSSTATEDDELPTVGASRFERLRQMTPPNAPPPPTPAINESMRRYEERKQERMKGYSSLPEEILQNGHNNSDLVDCASILEQKEQLKSFWEKKMMGDQSSPNEAINHDSTKSEEEKPHCNGVSSDKLSTSIMSEPEEVSLTNTSSDGQNQEEVVGEVSIVNGVTDQAQPELDTPTDAPSDSDKPQLSTELHTSVTEVEVHVETVAVESAELKEVKEEEPLQESSADVTETDSLSPAVEELDVNKSEPSTEPAADLEDAAASSTEVTPCVSTVEVTMEVPASDEIEAIPSAPLEEEVFSDEQVPVTEVKPASPPPVRVPTAPKHVTTVPTTEVPYSNFTTETKIAMEIREMREREEELIQMRERLSKLQIPAHREEATKFSSPPHSLDMSQYNGHAREQNMVRTVSLDSLVQQSSTPLFHHHTRRKDITVRPLADEEGDDAKPSYKVFSESPIEQEIKRAAEREEALRKEKGATTPTSGLVSPLAKSPTERVTKPKPLSTASYSGNTQRLLATSRIQQEIQEQTQREVALRETGQIRTISEERTDSKVARLGELSPEIHQTKKPPSPAAPLSPEIETRTPAAENGDVAAKFPSPTSSSSSSTSAVPPSRRLYTATSSAGGRGISMQRFIASRGKEVAFVTVAQKNGGVSPDKPSPTVDFPEVTKPTSPVRTGNGTAKPLVTSKRALTAESRIQQELMEMKAREEELRQQRVRLFGKSQPDLTILTNGNETSNGVTSEETDGESSVPSSKKKTEKDTILKGPRRRHTMIAEWEKIIQSVEGK